LGGSGYDQGVAIAVDSSGNAYVTGVTSSTDFPTVNAIQPTYHGGVYDAFVTKINASGSALVYSTYLGGSGLDSGDSIAVDSSGNAYVTGETSSTDFPTVNAIQPTNHGSDDAFVTKINADGSALVYSTYLGGSGEDWGPGIAVDSFGTAYVTGYTQSTDFPTVNAIQPTNHGSGDAFVTKINADGSALVYSTYLGGSGNDSGQSIAVDSSGSAYVIGITSSTDFPTVNAIQPTYHGNIDAFVTKINGDGSALVYSTYLGGSGGDQGYGIAADSSGNAYVIGLTDSTDFPTVNAIQPTYHGNIDAFVTKINADGSALVYSTYLGGSGYEQGWRIAVNPFGTAYISGQTCSTNFPKTLLAFQQSLKGSCGVYISKIASQSFVGVSPLKLVFPTKVIGTMSASKKLTFANKGSGTVTIKQIYVAGLNAGDFAETNNCPQTLPAAGFCTVSITFTPTSKDRRQALLGISDSDPASPQAIPLSGWGTVVSLSPNSLYFGKVSVHTTSSPKTVVLTNVGSTQLNFTGISITGSNATDYSQTNTCSTSIAAGGNCAITVTFTPTAQGRRTATVNISDDGGASPQKIVLAGYGT
jgi:hypothetical protein